MLNHQVNNSLGVNLAGHITGDFGLGEAARGTLRAMEAAKIPFAITDLKVGGQPNSDTSYQNFSNDNPYPINIVQTNPNWVEQILAGYFPGIGSEYFKGKYNIGVWLWELPVFPSEWQWAFDLFDEIWTTSNFCAEAFSAVSQVPVLKIPVSLAFPQPLLTRENLNLPKDKFIFLFMFDFGSSFERKNPFATVEAFKRAFGKSNPDVLLVLKFANAHLFPERRQELIDLAEGWSSLLFIDGHLQKAEIHALVNSCDCYVSLHRAEGFGLTMSEAMYYGKPVIATAYSSNMEFMNVGNSFPVKYELVTTTEDYGAYPKGSVWAEPDIDHAASLMNSVFENYQEAQKVGKIAAKEIRSLLSPQTVGIKIKNRLKFISGNLNHTQLSNRFHELQAERDLLARQAQAWRQTALQMQTELKHLPFHHH
ncbi:MAG: glycosyltransferase [Oscillatoriales cyanobacterium]|uniref:Glycosyltransferase family 4 protein n=1 Tax=Microcoleus anatoxicus PTRS2 TaxID=2705321 RepID=A0ABU8YLG4_9CYAN|nr:MAG: glycosyltransferase [Oscillatoriales cyanobacterium]TAF65247.1 MAG: glycosyltransferase [Oscillatoriales cyanobacterium]TAG92679.1 MAG: glycosyltransferase [Oscillatoriales cyanobacterium]TAH24474.1 MAG: glycosyltransferase [Oscillatoriales cyanobacterium]